MTIVDKSNVSCLPVQSHAFVSNNLEETTSPECFRVSLSLDLEHIQGQQGNFTNTNKTNDEKWWERAINDRLCCTPIRLVTVLPASSCVHHGLAGLFTERRGEHGLVVVVQEIIDKRLTTKLVHTLSDLVTSCESKTREEWGILLQDGCVRSILYSTIS